MFRWFMINLGFSCAKTTGNIGILSTHRGKSELVGFAISAVVADSP